MFSRKNHRKRTKAKSSNSAHLRVELLEDRQVPTGLGIMINGEFQPIPEDPSLNSGNLTLGEYFQQLSVNTGNPFPFGTNQILDYTGTNPITVMVNGQVVDNFSNLPLIDGQETLIFAGGAINSPNQRDAFLQPTPTAILDSSTTVPDFSLPDLHPSTPTSGQNLGPDTFRGAVSGYYFTSVG